MIRGTTPELSFTLPFNSDEISECYITFAQADSVIIEKTLNDCTKDNNTLNVSLSQEDTLKFKMQKVEIQLRIKTKDDKVLASNIISTTAKRILKDGVI